MGEVSKNEQLSIVPEGQRNQAGLALSETSIKVPRQRWVCLSVLLHTSGPFS